MTNTFTDYKFVVILNKKLETGAVLNASAHIALGLRNRATSEANKNMKFLDFIDNDGGLHPSISALSLIVLRSTSSEIRKARNIAIAHDILFTDFTSTMTGDTYVEQLERTKETDEADLQYYGLGLFGEKSILDKFTKKLSLWQ
jgi:Protein of unknown function (DUF2000)